MRAFLLICMSLVSACVESGETEVHRSPSGVVLQYHHVDSATPRITSTSPDEFRAHMAHLQAQDFTVWPLARLVDSIRNREATPDRVVAITFDDAYGSIYSTAFPILQSYGWPFTIFVATEPVDAAQSNYLTWAQLEEMKKAGATIANHTHTHTHLLRRLAGEDETAWLKRIEADIGQAQSLIERNLGEAPMLFAYPYGEYDETVAALIGSLGYAGFGQQSGAIGPALDFRVLPRFPFGGAYNDLEPFRTKVDTLPLPIVSIASDPMVHEDLRPTITLHFEALHPRFGQLVCYGPGGPTELERISDLEFRVRAIQDVPVGRSRYNCTMPSHEDRRFHWYSQLWIRKRPDGSWYPEP